MKKTRFSESQIISILKEGESGAMTVPELCRLHGVGQSTYYKWKSKYGGMQASDLSKMRELEAENAKLKKMFADVSLQNMALKDIVEKKAVKPAQRKELAQYAVVEFGLGVVLACDAMGISRCTYYYQPKLVDDNEIIEAVSELAQKHTTYGFKKIHKRLRLMGHCWNHKRVYRIYCGLKLNLRRKGKKRLPSRDPEPLVVPSKPNECWSMDFMSDNLYEGKSFRTFNVIDDYNRESLAIEIDSSLPSKRIIRVLDRIAAYRGYPKALRQDNGPEFISHALEIWAEYHGVKLDFIKPGKPTQNAYIERFNRTYRNEVLDCYLFKSLTEVREITDSWMVDYNYERPHESLNDLPPKEYERLDQENSLEV